MATESTASCVIEAEASKVLQGARLATLTEGVAKGINSYCSVSTFHSLFPPNPRIHLTPDSDYSVLKLFTGFAIAAFIALKLIVTNAMSVAIKPATKNIHQLIEMR